MHRLIGLVVVLGLAAGCTPRPTPPYADFRRAEAPAPADALAAALLEAGWAVAEPAAPGIVTTAPRRVQGVARTTARLDLLPLGGGVVRVLVRAEQRGLLSGRSKVYALSPRLRHAVLADLSVALRARGLLPLPEARRRDEDAARR